MAPPDRPFAKLETYRSVAINGASKKDSTTHLKASQAFIDAGAGEEGVYKQAFMKAQLSAQVDDVYLAVNGLTTSAPGFTPRSTRNDPVPPANTAPITLSDLSPAERAAIATALAPVATSINNAGPQHPVQPQPPAQPSQGPAQPPVPPPTLNLSALSDAERTKFRDLRRSAIDDAIHFMQQNDIDYGNASVVEKAMFEALTRIMITFSGIRNGIHDDTGGLPAMSSVPSIPAQTVIIALDDAATNNAAASNNENDDGNNEDYFPGQKLSSKWWTKGEEDDEDEFGADDLEMEDDSGAAVENEGGVEEEDEHIKESD